jgi:hypothetical protein
MDPLHVVIDQTSSPTPEWIKTLVTAGIGAVLAILSTVVIEPLRATVLQGCAVRRLRKKMCSEVTENVRILDAILQGLKLSPVIDQVHQDMLSASIKGLLTGVTSDRFDFYKEKSRDALFDLKAYDDLRTFHWQTERAKQQPLGEFSTMVGAVELAYSRGTGFLSENGCGYDQKVDLLMVAAITTS